METPAAEAGTDTDATARADRAEDAGIRDLPAVEAAARAVEPALPDAGDPDLEALVGRLADMSEPRGAGTDIEIRAGSQPVDLASAAETDGDRDDLLATIRGGLGLDEGGMVASAAERPEAPAADVQSTPTAAEAPAEPSPAAPSGPGVVTPIRARVIKVRRSERPASPEPAAVETPAGGRLSPEAEADLARELAALEREMAGLPPAPPAPGEPAAEPAPKLRDRVPSDAPADEAVNRLMRQADSEMEGAETRRRAATIAHLKAAVAATVAERAATGAPRDDADDRREPYREDLARAVRPRRPEALPGAGRPRPETATRIPPLVLVSEQRVDRPATAPANEAAPVRPRRVTSGSLALNRDLDEIDDPDEPIDDAVAAPAAVAPARFLDLVERLGATQPADIVEVAAVFVTVEEGRDSFTRPMLMRYAASLGAGRAIDREESLRAFGSLLRDGRIVKARRGLYALAEDNRALAKARSFAG